MKTQAVDVPLKKVSFPSEVLPQKDLGVSSIRESLKKGLAKTGLGNLMKTQAVDAPIKKVSFPEVFSNPKKDIDVSSIKESLKSGLTKSGLGNLFKKHSVDAPVSFSSDVFVETI
jgi:hypothetical protein